MNSEAKPARDPALLRIEGQLTIFLAIELKAAFGHPRRRRRGTWSGFMGTSFCWFA
jgi:hypothetical protein